MPPPSDIFENVPNDLRANLAAVRKKIERAASLAGRNADKIKLVAVSKTHPAPVLNEAVDAGINTFGENKVQEAESKIVDVGRDAAEWHLIGHLQSNKARKAVQLFDVIHSIDSIELATRLERICVDEGRRDLSVLVQVDLAGEDTKSGVAETELAPVIEYLSLCSCLKLDGLMVLPPYFDDPGDARPFFMRLRELRDDLARQNAFGNGPGELSMGMSHDFEIAIEEGATIVRIGTAIFGERQVGDK